MYVEKYAWILIQIWIIICHLSAPNLFFLLLCGTGAKPCRYAG